MNAKYIDSDFAEIAGSMFAYRTGKQLRKHKPFFKELQILLQTSNNPSIDDVCDGMDTQYTPASRTMVRSRIKRGGRAWLEGENKDIFGETFATEYMARWDVAHPKQDEEIKNREVILSELDAKIRVLNAKQEHKVALSELDDKIAQRKETLRTLMEETE